MNLLPLIKILEIVGIKNATNVRINPATTEKQEEIITALASVISTNNSSTTPLGIDGVFEGDAEEITQYAAIQVIILTDKDSATDGLSVEYSPDGTNWDHTETHGITANVAHVSQGMVEAKYFRIVYTNGGEAQGFFRLQVMCKQEASLGEVFPLDHEVHGPEDAQLVRAVLSALKPNGDYENIGATAGGNLKLSLEELETQAVDQIRVVGGTGTDGTVALASADTWYQVPQSGSVPGSSYNLAVSPENVGGIIRWSYDNGGTPSTTNGNKGLEDYDTLIVELAADEVMYFGSDNAGDDVNWTAKII